MARSALFVSSATYADDQLTRLPSAASDAVELGRVVGDPTIGGFSVATLTDPQAQEMRETLEDFLTEAEPDDLLVVYLSGHGLKDPRGSLFFAAHDTRVNRLQSTAVPAYFLCSLLNMSRAGGIVVFLDCCYGGAFARGMVTRADGDPHVGDAFTTLGQGARARAVVTASSAIEYAFESERLAESHAEPSVFAAAMRDGILRGDADRDGDGWVGLNELFDYVTQRISQLGRPQTPHLWTFGLSGDLRLTRSPRGPRASASALPQEIRELLASPLPAVRYGAVSELADRAASADVEVARAAVAAMANLAEDDSLRVRAAIDAAMASIAPRVEPTTLSVQAPHSGAATIEARIEVPAIAQDAYIEPVVDGVTADVVGAEITVHVSQSAPVGDLTLNLRWAGGVVSIPLAVRPAESTVGLYEPSGVAAIPAAGTSASPPNASVSKSEASAPARDRTDRPGWLIAAAGLLLLSLLVPYSRDSAAIVEQADAYFMVPLLASVVLPVAAGIYRLDKRRGRASLVAAVILTLPILFWSLLGIGITISDEWPPGPGFFTFIGAVACSAVYLVSVIRQVLATREPNT